jgi:hypothetical protein
VLFELLHHTTHRNCIRISPWRVLLTAPAFFVVPTIIWHGCFNLDLSFSLWLVDTDLNTATRIFCSGQVGFQVVICSCCNTWWSSSQHTFAANPWLSSPQYTGCCHLNTPLIRYPLSPQTTACHHSQAIAQPQNSQQASLYIEPCTIAPFTCLSTLFEQNESLNFW